MELRSHWIRIAAAGILVCGFVSRVSAQESIPAQGVSYENPAKLEQPVPTLAELVDQAIEVTSKRRLTANVHTPWQIVHGILALRWEFMLAKGNGPGEINAIEWMASGPSFEGLPLWEKTPYGGRGQPFTRPYAFEGHPTQFMGYMSMADIPLDYEFEARGGTITIRDIINDAKMQVREGPEITWTLWAVSHYEDPESQWINNAREPWSIERLMRIQVNEHVTMGACGGTHGLYALAYARNMYLSTGKPLRGVWLEADQKIKRYVLESKTLQNPDGSFSTEYFSGPGYSNDFGERIKTSGHQLEWLMIAQPQSKLKQPWFEKAIENIAKDLIANRKTSSDCGPLYHALHALVVYRQRTNPEFRYPTPTSPLKVVDRKKARTAPVVKLKPYAAPIAKAPAAVLPDANGPKLSSVKDTEKKDTEKTGKDSEKSGDTTAAKEPAAVSKSTEKVETTTKETVESGPSLGAPALANDGPKPGEKSGEDKPAEVKADTEKAANEKTGDEKPAEATAGREPAPAKK